MMGIKQIGIFSCFILGYKIYIYDSKIKEIPLDKESNEGIITNTSLPANNSYNTYYPNWLKTSEIY